MVSPTPTPTPPFQDCCQNLCIHPAPKKNRIFQLALKIPTVNKHLPVFLLGTELCIPLKIFAALSKHLPVFLLGTENVMGGGGGGWQYW